MRIAYVITRGDAVGGASIHVRDLSKAMLERGHDVRVFVGGTGPVLDQLQGVPVESLRFLARSLHPLRDFAAWRELKAALASYGPDIVSAHTAKAGFLGRAASKSLGIPVVYTPHGWSVSDRISKSQGAVFTVVERVAAPWASAIVCVSEAERRLAIEKNIGRPDQLRVIHNGVRDVPASMRARPAESPVRIVSVARLEPPKDHATLLEALGQLRDLSWHLELIGDGPLGEAVGEQAARLGVGERVVFRGYLTDPAEALARAQIFVLSSRSEGFPRSILEAMRAGLPVVASDVGGVREAIGDCAVPAGSSRAMAEALRRLIVDGSLRAREGASMRAAYEARFRLDRMLDETAGLYAEILSSRS